MNLHVLWGKAGASSTGGDYHPLTYHMVDTGCVARLLLGPGALGHVASRLGSLMQMDVSLVPGVVAYLVSLHDVGKVAPGFQAKMPMFWPEVEGAGLIDTHPLIPPKLFRHDVESYAGLVEILPDLPGLRIATERPRRVHRLLALALGAHHGSFITSGDTQGYPQVSRSRPERDEAWLAGRDELVAMMQRAFLPTPAVLTVGQEALTGLFAWLNGLTVLCDWLGSSERYFPHARAALSDEEYLARAETQAARAIDAVGLLKCPLHKASPTFATLFPRIRKPYPIQSAVDEQGIPPPLPPLPFLAVIEAPMGEGKTEAALLLARRLAAAERGGGFYVALPTQAASDQLFLRVVRFLEGIASPDELASVMLAHGQADLSRMLQALLHPGVADPDPDADAAENVQADSWFLPRKRRLLAPFGVGTVDQCLLGALQVRHVSLRLLGLAGKVVIFDEVHAYDTYMSTILERLLEWLRALGASAILLSATLPSRLRERLIGTYFGREGATEGQAYPLITLVDGEGRVQALSPPPGRPARAVAFVRLPADERENNARHLLSRLAHGGCAAWICNTVGSAQESYLALKEAASRLPEGERPQVILYHARMLQKDRRRVEETVLALFGKDAGDARPHKAVVVATQVVEQSLDIDFDLVMTEICPIDLLLQRIGRLHRHERGMRPRGVSAPYCVLLTPARAAGGALGFGPTGLIYDRFVLVKTLVALRGRDELTLPRDIRPLVEAVYNDEIPDSSDLSSLGISSVAVAQARRALLDGHARAASEANMRLLRSPRDRSWWFNENAPTLDDDTAEQDGWVAAQTRLAEPTARVVLVPTNHPWLCAGGPLRADKALDLELAQEVLAHSVTISHRGLVKALEATPPPKCFERTPLLRGYHLLPLDGDTYSWKASGRRFVLAVSPELGVTIKEEGQ